MIVVLILAAAYLLLPSSLGVAGVEWRHAAENLWFSADGVFTIPIIKKVGFKPQFAGGVEAAASSHEPSISRLEAAPTRVFYGGLDFSGSASI